MSPTDDGLRRNGPSSAQRKPRRVPAEQARGSLVLIGGGCTPHGDALGSFLRLSGADHGAPVVGFTTASRNPKGAAAAWKRDFMAAGVSHVEIPIVDTRN